MHVGKSKPHHRLPVFSNDSKWELGGTGGDMAKINNNNNIITTTAEIGIHTRSTLATVRNRQQVLIQK